jgi:ABC-type multidrug transport system fused ATPase/permease subunit
MKKYILNLKTIIIIKILTDTLYVISIASIPYIIKSLIDYDFSKGIGGIIFLILIYLLAAVLGMTFQYITQFYIWKLDKSLYLLIKSDIFNKILSFKTPKYKEVEIGSYVSMIDNEVPVVKQYLSSGISIIQSAIQIIIYGIYMFILDPSIAVIIISVSCLTLFLPKLTSNELAKRRATYLKSTGNYISIVENLLSGFKHVNSETRRYIRDEHDENMKINENNMLKYGKYNTFVNVFNGFFMYLLDISAFALVAVLLLNNKISYGTAMATLVCIKEFVYPIRYLISDITTMKSAKGSKDKIMTFLDQDTEEKFAAKGFNYSINFIDVSIKYNDFHMMNFNYSFKKGKKYVIIGESGSGKSTLLNLLTNNIELDSGKIEIDDTNINLIDTSLILANIKQFEPVFKTDFRKNSTLFGTYSESSMNSTIEYINNKRLDKIKEKKDCSSLSGGERQLLALTQIKIRNKEILLFDEAFSALDFENKVLLEEKFYGLENKTIIAVTHNITDKNLSYFDEILYMENGSLVNYDEHKLIV